MITREDAFLRGKSPPTWVIDMAREIAMGRGQIVPRGPDGKPQRSMCHKSSRGVVLYNPELEHERIKLGAEINALIAHAIVAGAGRNGPPHPFVCDGGSLECRSRCNKYCVHAEDRAIRSAGVHDDVNDLELVHVKVIDESIVPGGPPSCWQCSRTILEVNLRGVWLLEVERGWVFRTAEAFHLATLEHCGLVTP